MEEKEVTLSQAGNIFTAINNVMSKVGYVQKEKGKEGGLKYTYASESALIAALRPAMVEEKIIIYCVGITDVEVREYESRSEVKMANVSLTGHWRYVHATTGTSLEVSARGEGSDSSDKANNKAMTGSFKYALRQTFMIETGDDPDKDQTDERKSSATKVGEPSAVFSREQIEAAMATQAFGNKYEAMNALRLSKCLTKTTGLVGIGFWVLRYKDFRILESKTPEEAAVLADSEYLAEKARKTQDASQA